MVWHCQQKEHKSWPDGKAPLELVKADGDSYRPLCQTNLVIVLHELSQPIILQFYKHNSSPFGLIRAFVSPSTKRFHPN